MENNLSSDENGIPANERNLQIQESNSALLLQVLNQALDKTIHKSVSFVRLSLFMKNYRKIAKKNPESVKKIHQKVTQQLEETIKSQVQAAMDEDHLMKIMAELGAVMDEAKSAEDKIAWRPSGKPSEDLRSHLMPIKLKQKQKLEALLSSHETDVKVLQKMVTSRRARLTSTEKQAQDAVHRLSQVTQGLDMERLQEELVNIKFEPL